MASEQLELDLERRDHLARMVKGLLDSPGRASFPRGAPEGLSITRRRVWIAMTYDLLAAYAAVHRRTDWRAYD
jgi:hypothetical protein